MNYFDPLQMLSTVYIYVYAYEIYIDLYQSSKNDMVKSNIYYMAIYTIYIPIYTITI